MKTVRNSALTKERIIQAATLEFAEKGYDGATIDDISNRAKANKNLLYSYFGKKDELFQEVLERAYEKLRLIQDDLSIKGLDPEQGMEEFIRHTFRAFIEIPEIIRLAISENLHEALHMRRSKRIKELFNPLPDTISKLLSSGVEKGVFRGGVDPIHLYISIVSLCSYYISNQYTLSLLLKRNVNSKKMRIDREEHVVEIIMQYVRR